MKKIDLPGIGNARELGGLRIGDKTIRPGKLIRTASLVTASQEALDKLSNEYHVGVVIDLRMSLEHDQVPDPVIPGAVGLWLPVIDIDEMIALNKDKMKDMDIAEFTKTYIDPNTDRMVIFDMAYESGMMDENLYDFFLFSNCGREAYRRFFEELLHLPEDKAALWHCTDGKDRTGCASMLILHALGADRDTIMKDYLYTNEMNAQRLAMIREKISPMHFSDEKLEVFLFASGGVSEKYLTHVMNRVEKEYGSMDNFLAQELGVGEEEKKQLRAAYLI